MVTYRVLRAKNVQARFSGVEVQLPKYIQDKINLYWDELIAGGKSYTRGEVFTVTHKEVVGDTIDILVEKTDYAHYLYCQNKELLSEYGVRIIHTAALVETCDGYFIFGEMGSQTARHGIVQLCGGGIDTNDLKDGCFDFRQNIIRELQEELGIDIFDGSRIDAFDEAYLKEGGPTDKMTVIFKVILSEEKDEFLMRYHAFTEILESEGESPEFGRIITLKKDKGVIEEFFAQEGVRFDEYMQPLFARIVAEL